MNELIEAKQVVEHRSRSYAFCIFVWSFYMEYSAGTSRRVPPIPALLVRLPAPRNTITHKHRSVGEHRHFAWNLPLASAHHPPEQISRLEGLGTDMLNRLCPLHQQRRVECALIVEGLADSTEYSFGLNY
jgi:hypothetical protein